MEIRVLFFASLREAAGSGVETIEVEPGTTVSSLWSRISNELDRLPEKVLCAVDQEYVDPGYIIRSNDHEVAFFPPVTGG